LSVSSYLSIMILSKYWSTMGSCGFHWKWTE